MSIIRVGLAETKNFAEGFDAIFGKKKPANGKAAKAAEAKPAEAEPPAEAEEPAKKAKKAKKK